MLYIVPRRVFDGTALMRPQSDHIRPQKFSPFFQIRTSKKVLTAHRGPIYQIKASEIPCEMQKTCFRFDKYMCVSETLNMDSFGEILREFGEILGKYRMLDGRSPGSIGLNILTN